MTREEMIGKIHGQFMMGRRGNFGLLDLSADILAAIEPAIRADERARVVAEATSDEAVERAAKVEWTEYMVEAWDDMDEDEQEDARRCMRSAIRAALGTTEG